MDANTWLFVSLAAFPVIVAAYVMLARKEEQHMVDRFGDEYLEYRKRVPMFFPHRGEWDRLFQPSGKSSLRARNR